MLRRTESGVYYVTNYSPTQRCHVRIYSLTFLAHISGLDVPIAPRQSSLHHTIHHGHQSLHTTNTQLHRFTSLLERLEKVSIHVTTCLTITQKHHWALAILVATTAMKQAAATVPLTMMNMVMRSVQRTLMAVTVLIAAAQPTVTVMGPNMRNHLTLSGFLFFLSTLLAVINCHT